MDVREKLVYVGSLIFFFVLGGLLGASVFRETDNIFLICGFVSTILGMLIARLFLNLTEI